VSLESELRNWDRKSAKAIIEIHENNSADENLMDRLVSLAGVKDLETGATWLLKHRLENALDKLDPDQTLRLVDLLPGLSDWEAKLHCLQIFPHIAFSGPSKQTAWRFLLACSREPNKFVRAWAYSGLHQLALDHPAYREQARAVLEAAKRSETAASVKVRLRKALEQDWPEDPA
jgi:hypothetical protein